jgi:hypothetical protein
MRKNFTSGQTLYTVRNQKRNTGGGTLSQGGNHRTNLLQVEAAGGGQWDRGAGTVGSVGRREQELKARVADQTLNKHMLRVLLRKFSKASAQASLV